MSQICQHLFALCEHVIGPLAPGQFSFTTLSTFQLNKIITGASKIRKKKHSSAPLGQIMCCYVIIMSSLVIALLSAKPVPLFGVKIIDIK